MIRFFKGLAAALPILLFLGCSSEEETRVGGYHFQGKDCLLCHNVDLEESSHLAFGGTVFSSVPTLDTINTKAVYCNKPLFVQLLNDLNNSVQYDSRDNNKVGDPGFKAEGNIFSKTAIPAGSYLVKVIDLNGTEVLSSVDEIAVHDFGGHFNPDAPNDNANRYSCNACHKINGSASPLVAQNYECKE